MIFSGSAPMQPVTITLPFSAIASPMAASDSACAESRKPQVLTIVDVRAGMAAREFIALGAQPRDDALGIDQRLGAAQRNEGYARRGGHERLLNGERAALGQAADPVNRKIGKAGQVH